MFPLTMVPFWVPGFDPQVNSPFRERRTKVSFNMATHFGVTGYPIINPQPRGFLKPSGAANEVRTFGRRYLWVQRWASISLAFCLDVRTFVFCQFMGFPLNH